MIRSYASTFARPRALFGVVSVGLMALGATLTGCVSTPVPGYGAQVAHEGFVPARTAILPCRIWPSHARYKGLPLTSLADAGITELCADLDLFVIQSFDNQPYMKGFSPKFVLKALETAGVASTEATIGKLWAWQGNDPEGAAGAPSAPALYQALLAKRPEWQEWLAGASAAVRNADAILMPFLLYADERRYDDRGLAVVERKAGVALLLIDTASGALIWAGGREAAVPTKRLTRGNVPGDLAPAPWDAVMERLQSEDLWRDYPGRQVF